MVGFGMDTLIAISALASVFVGAFVSLVMVCRHRSLRSKNAVYMKTADSEHKTVQLDNTTLLGLDLELGEVLLHPYIEHVLLTEEWTSDASELITHCLEIVKLCRHVTNTIAAYSVGHHNSKALCEIVQVAKQVSDCVDEVVRTLYCPPVLDASSVAGRCAALVSAVDQLIRVADRPRCQLAQQQMCAHLKVLREAALVRETVGKHITTSGSGSDSNNDGNS